MRIYFIRFVCCVCLLFCLLPFISLNGWLVDEVFFLFFLDRKDLLVFIERGLLKLLLLYKEFTHNINGYIFYYDFIYF